MNDLIWSFEALARLCAHQDWQVRVWAAGRMRCFYPEEAAQVMTGLLDDKNEGVVMQAAAYFSDHPDGNVADSLLAAFKRSSGITANRLALPLAVMKDGRLLEAVLDKHARIAETDPAEFVLVLMNVARLKTEASQRYVEDALRQLGSFGDFNGLAAGAVFKANIEAGTEMEKLLLFAYRSGEGLYLPALLSEIANRAGAWCPADALPGNFGKGKAAKLFAGQVEESLGVLAESALRHSGEVIKKLYKKKKFEEVLEGAHGTSLAVLQARRQECGEEAYLRWQTGREIPFFHCAALAALGATAAEAPAAQGEVVAGIAIIVLACLSEMQSLIAVNPETLDADGAYDLFFEDRLDAPQDDALMAILAKESDGKGLAREAVDLVAEFPFARANGRLIRFAGRFMDEELARGLLAVDFGGNGFEEDAAEAVSSLGAAVIPLLRPFFGKRDRERIPLSLEVLVNLPIEASVDLILTHWSLLWDRNREGLLDAVESMGDKRFIPALKAGLKAGERDEDEVFQILCLINGATDPELERIEREMALRQEKVKRMQDAMARGDIEAILREPLEVSLECRSCRSVCHYTVGKVLVAAGTQDMVIEGPIVCKKCGALDHYEIDAEGTREILDRFELLTLETEKVRRDWDGITVVPIQSVSAFGKELSFRDLVARYESKLKKNPESPELLIGLANAFCRVKRREDAASLYERAIQSDPLAVEGYVSLGEYAFDKGDLETAFSRYGRAAEIMDRGHFYRVRTDLDQFKEYILDKLMMISEGLGRAFPHPGAPLPGDEAPAPARSAVGRNHPCPCGSGKKYKKCCLLKESAQGAAPDEPEQRRPPAPDPVFRRLREKLNRYAEREAYRKDFLRATGIYWNTEPREPIELPERASHDQGEFIDWYLHDYCRVNGKTILEEFCDRYLNALSADEKRLAQSFLKSRLSLYEVKAVREGEGMTIRDVFTGEAMDVEEVSGSYHAVLWDLLWVRVYRIDGVCRFGGNGQVIPRARLESLKAFLDSARRTFEADTGRAGWHAFLKERAFLIGHFLEEAAAEPPVLFTEERHRMILSRARFTVSDAEGARKRLSGEYDFSEECDIPGGGARFSWLKRGPSKAWEMGAEEEGRGMIATSSVVHPSGKMTFTVLGTVELHSDRLILECMSRERLDRGKKRLRDLLQSMVLHRVDEFEDIHGAMERHGEKGEAAKPLNSQEARAMLTSLMQKHLSDWPDQGIPALGGKTPREAVVTKAGREKVIDLLKEIENGEARKKRAGEPFVDLGPLKRELGIGEE